jgi:hypothetical protein
VFGITGVTMSCMEFAITDVLHMTGQVVATTLCNHVVPENIVLPEDV